MSQKGILVVVSGFSGAGKGTLMKKLLKEYSDRYALSISATTRAPREGEQHGREYFFVPKEEFEQMIRENALVEYACYVGNYYGTPKQYVLDQMEAGKDVILEIEIQGALKIREVFPEACLLFIAPPNAGELERRLRGRGTESEAEISKRLKRAAEEAEYMDQYDHILINDTLELCAEKMHQLIQAQHSASCFQKQFIAQMKEELKVLQK